MTAGKNNYHTHISSQHNWFDLKLKEVWRYRDLIWLFTKRSFTLSYKQTVLGPIWILITPLLSSFVYTFLFGTVAGMSTDGIPQTLFYLCGNAIWAFFSGALGNASPFSIISTALRMAGSSLLRNSKKSFVSIMLLMMAP